MHIPLELVQRADFYLGLPLSKQYRESRVLGPYFGPGTDLMPSHAMLDGL